MIYEEKPEGFRPAIEVSGCYVEYAGTFLLLHRCPEIPAGNVWGLPAGKVDPGETPMGAMRRELSEETGLDIPEKELSYVTSLPVRHDNLDLLFHIFRCTREKKEEVKLNPGEHQAYRWVTPEDGLAMNLVEDQDACIKIIYKI